MKTWIVLAAFAAVLGLAGLQTLRLANEKTAHANTNTSHANQRTDWERETRVAVEAARTEEQRRTAQVQKAANEGQRKLDAANEHAVVAAAAGQRLRNRIAELTAAASRVTPGDTTAAGPSPPAPTTADLLADVQRRVDEAADATARFADQSHARGNTCERIYDALTP